MLIFFELALTDLSVGEVWMMRGGVSSYQPPSGVPMRAQLKKMRRNEDTEHARNSALILQ
jgi:hypothetical protein